MDGCGCGHDCGCGHGHGHKHAHGNVEEVEVPFTKAEKLKMLADYKKMLDAEAKNVAKQIAELKKSKDKK